VRSRSRKTAISAGLNRSPCDTRHADGGGVILGMVRRGDCGRKGQLGVLLIAGSPSPQRPRIDVENVGGLQPAETACSHSHDDLLVRHGRSTAVAVTAISTPLVAD